VRLRLPDLGQRIASMPLRLMTLSRASAAPVSAAKESPTRRWRRLYVARRTGLSMPILAAVSSSSAWRGRAYLGLDDKGLEAAIAADELTEVIYDEEG
jgi:hypothetical protein